MVPWLLFSVLVLVVAPRFTRRLGEGLARREGLEESIEAEEAGTARGAP